MTLPDDSQISKGPLPLEALVYAAATIDGEGSIFIGYCRGRASDNRKYMQIRLNVGNTDPRMPAKMHEWFGGSFKRGKGESRQKQYKRMPLFLWDIGAYKALRCLKAIYPYLLIKKEQADIALKFAETMRPRGKKWRLTDEEYAAREKCNVDLRLLKKWRPTSAVG